MEEKDKNIVLYQKLFCVIFCGTISLFLISGNSKETFIIGVNYFLPKGITFLNLTWAAVINDTSKAFIFIVGLVTLMVIQYRISYSESYNNKKLFALTTVFFLSILTLVSSLRIINLILGWEILGFSSIFLVIFYPNKTSLSNTSLTMIYNRIGDAFLIFVLIYTLRKGMRMINIIILNKLTIILIIICAATKRAQFPLSAWLPAAISAPTPISAIVHSSTLVTAGIFLLMTFWNYVKEVNMIIAALALSFSSFYVGGILANQENDLKKMVAFSTIRQISIIILFLLRDKVSIAYKHIFYHALFKTFLFCAAGMLFTASIGSQLFLRNISSNHNKLSAALINVRIFIISGVIFRASYFTKDCLIEQFLEYPTKRFLFLILFIGGLMTLLYCRKIMLVLKSSTKSNTVDYQKNRLTWFFIIFMVILILVEPFNKATNINNKNLLIPLIELLLLNLLVLIVLIVKEPLKQKNTFLKLKITVWQRRIFIRSYIKERNILKRIYLLVNSDRWITVKIKWERKIGSNLKKYTLINMESFKYLWPILILVLSFH